METIITKALKKWFTLIKNTLTIINLGITVKIALMLIGKTLEHISIEVQIKKKIEEVEARA